MTLTPLTPAQVGGSLGDDEIRAMHISGDKIGMVLVYKKNDPELATAQNAGEVVVDGPALLVPPTFTSVTPNTSPPVADFNFAIAGTNIPADAFVEFADVDAENQVINPNGITGTVDLNGKTPGAVTVTIFQGQTVIGTLPFTITAP